MQEPLKRRQNSSKIYLIRSNEIMYKILKYLNLLIKLFVCIFVTGENNLIDFSGPKWNALVYVYQWRNAMHLNFQFQLLAHFLASYMKKKGFVLYKITIQSKYMQTKMKTYLPVLVL